MLKFLLNATKKAWESSPREVLIGFLLVGTLITFAVWMFKYD